MAQVISLGKPEPSFDMMIMDEASQCNTAVSLVPIIRGNNFSTKKVRKLYILFIVISCLLLVFGLLKTMWGLAVVGLFIMACAVFFYLVCYRCHNCGKFLGRDSVKHCPHCGSEVDK